MQKGKYCMTSLLCEVMYMYTYIHVCVYVAELFCCTPGTITILLIGYIPKPNRASLAKCLPAIQETRVQSLVGKIP